MKGKPGSADPRPGEDRRCGPGEVRLRSAIRRHRDRRARLTDPQPYDNDWGWWIEKRLARLETQTRWLVGLAGAAVAAEVVRVALSALGLLP